MWKKIKATIFRILSRSANFSLVFRKRSFRFVVWTGLPTAFPCEVGFKISNLAAYRQQFFYFLHSLENKFSVRGMDGIAYGVPLGEGLQNFKPSCLSTAVFLFSALPRKQVFRSWHGRDCLRLSLVRWASKFQT